MRKNILYIKASSLLDVRLNKFYTYFKQSKEYAVHFIGWDRYRKKIGVEDKNVRYILSGILGNLPLSYCIFMLILFIRLLFISKNKFSTIICINFETALPMYLVSKIRKVQYIYEIYDEFSKSYNFPKWLKKILSKIDIKIINRANYVIHVDNNRIIGPEREKSIVIENTPPDYWNGDERDYTQLKRKFAIIGHFSKERGMEQIYKFAYQNQSISFLLAGKFTNVQMKETFLALKNVEYHEFMPQAQLFEHMEECCGIFSLYNPRLEINKYAASNKVYDAMMMGIPVITNKEVINSGFIRENNLGFVVDYQFGVSWGCLCGEDFLNKAIDIGTNARNLYLRKYQFSELIEQRLLPILNTF